MPFLGLLSRDVDVERAVRRPLQERHVVARAGGWDRFVRLLRERPVTVAVLDESSLPAAAGTAGAVAELRSGFPSLPLVLVARPDTDPFSLLRLGRAGVERLILVRVDDLEHPFGRARRVGFPRELVAHEKPPGRPRPTKGFDSASTATDVAGPWPE